MQHREQHAEERVHGEGSDHGDGRMRHHQSLREQGDRGTSPSLVRRCRGEAGATATAGGVYDREAVEAFVQGWGLTIAKCTVIALVFVAAWLHLARELAWVRALTDHLGFELVADQPGTKAAPSSLAMQVIRDEAHSIATAKDPAWAQKQVRSWLMRAQRLEPALAFWTDLLRQLGLLGTVLGLGIALAIGGDDVAKLLGPLALAIWTTIVGLACSILLSAMFAMRLTAWVDACEKNIEAWDSKRQQRREAP
jgi:biopolymer transport protein ExbB/TolQ